jgi:cytochrome c oxidase cbb3-type subunit I/II
MTTSAKTTVTYDDRTVRWFMLASVFWGAVAMLAGVYIAFQLNYWKLNLDLPWLTFGRLRPLHTNAAIFAFVGNMMFAGIYHSTQRLCKVRTASDLLSRIHFWGWQLIIAAAAVTLPLGLTRGKEYAELIWPINIAVAAIWVVFAVNFFWTLAKRNEPSLYVAIWFYIATIVTVAMLYIVNHLSLPTSWTHSYTIFGGVQDALVQWWYGHNAVAFFLTTPILGIMYYYLPKAANRPVYSYRLSVVHFWSLVFLYIWAGPHHLLNTSLPHWLQALGMGFSLMLWAPSWGGMLNGLLTLRGAWDKVREDPVLKFFAAGVTFYGMSTFEGPLLSIRAVNTLSHYSDWTIGHVHSGTLGWNGFMAAGMFYWMVPKLWKTKLFSKELANFHFWIGFVGILLYVGAMWASGIRQGLMLNALDDTGTAVRYTEFVETLTGVQALMLFRALGGSLYLLGWILLVFNVLRSIAGAQPVDTTVEVTVQRETREGSRLGEMIFAEPSVAMLGIVLFSCLWLVGGPVADWIALALTALLAVLSVQRFRRHKEEWIRWYDRLSEHWIPFTVLALIAVAVGGAIQIIPTVTVNRAANIEDRLQKVHTPLELAGRDLYVSEGCYNCHSQMIRMLVPDVLRYGDYSRIGESIYDHPFQWGSKRTGPDLAREGGRRPDSWHYQHMLDPRSTSPGSNMPAYPWLYDAKTDFKALPNKIRTLVHLGVPYPTMTRDEIEQGAREQAMKIAEGLKQTDPNVDPESQIIALIAYLQALGKYDDLQAPAPPAATAAVAP